MLRLKRKPGWMALDGIAAALAGLLLLELHLAIAPPAVNARRAFIASQTPHVQSRDLPPQAALSAWREMMLSRPIFDPTRRPPAAVATAPLQIPRLSGIMVTPTEKIAVFSPTSGAPIVIDQHGRFGPFTVLAISDDSVTIQSPGGIIVLRSNFSNSGPEISTTRSTLLAAGMNLSLIKIALPTKLSWPAPSPSWPGATRPSTPEMPGP